MRGVWCLLRTLVVWTAAGFTLALLLAAAIPLALGDRSYVVRSGSMAPAIDTGDVVMVEPVAAPGAKVGDIVTFKLRGRPLTSHRVRSMSQSGGKVHFLTQGDANTGQERWVMPVHSQVGRVVYRIPKLGYLVAKVQTPAGRVGLILVPASLLAVSLLAGIWRREQPEEAAGEPAR